ncbi:MAG: glycosyltransferase, partial [Sphingobacteriaceae bacterium]
MPAIYQAADLFIYPSKFEGFGIPIIEALHSETPVIAAKGSCLAEAGGPNSLYFEPSNAEELVGLIANLLADESKRKSMAASGK